MDRRTFLGRAGVAVAALTVGRLPHTAPETEPVAAATSFEVDAAALTAAGGFCAPITPFYNLAMVERPIRDALPAIRFSRPPDA